MDLVTTSMRDGKVVWFRNNGARPPTFTAITITSTAGTAMFAVISDLDNDNDEVIIGGLSSLETKLNSLAGPACTCIVASGKPILCWPSGVVSQDIVSASRSGQIQWLENSGASSPTFTARSISTSFSGPYSLKVADLNKDGRLDVVCGSADDNTVVWFANSGTSPPTFIANVITTTALMVTGVDVIDVDGNGSMDGE
jgi:hypothetical protein